MNAKGRRYLILLLVSVVIRIFFYFFPFKDTFLEEIAKTHILYDVIFNAVMISLLELLKDRKWIIGITWIALVGSIAYNILDWINDASSVLPPHLYNRSIIIIGFFLTIFYVCIFFVRKSPARIFIRGMTAVTFLPYVYAILAFFLHLPGPDAWMSSATGGTIMSILINLLLALAVWRTPELRQPEYADFLT